MTRQRAALCALAVVAASAAFGAGEEPRLECEACGRILRVEVPETRLSGDPEFKRAGMFQRCQGCWDRTMNRAAQLTHERIVRRYKENSIRHNAAVRDRGRGGSDLRRSASRARRLPVARGNGPDA